MKHILNFDDEGKRLLEDLFQKIYKGNLILFLGSGASVTDENKFLSKDIIELYEAEINKKIGTIDIVEFVDILSRTSDFSRRHYDDFVHDLLKKLEPTEEHKILSHIPWRQIITTNMDILVERAYDEIRNTADFQWEIEKVRSTKEYNKFLVLNQIKLIKLHGCISDRNAFPFRFSTEDFAQSRPFYKVVLNNLKSVSDRVEFISFGYSYNDAFSKKLMTEFDKYDFRGRRWFHHIEPNVNEDRLEYFSSNKIRVIKSSFREFFNMYNDWETLNQSLLVRSKAISFFSRQKAKINVKPKTLLRLSPVITQLEDTGKYNFIKPEDFYKGEEPNFGIVLKNYDVIREELIDSVDTELSSYTESFNSNIIPIFFLKGNFGTGKSTFTYRLINSLMHKISADSLAFEVVDPIHIDLKDLKELIQEIKEKEIILFFNFIERDHFFKLLLDVRNKLSKEQLTDKKILILASIRENLLEKYKKGRTIPGEYEINIDKALTDDEINDLLDKLKYSGLITFRDIKEKKELLIKIKRDFSADSYVTLLNLVNGKHFKDLVEAYNGLPEIAQRAFLYTALLHRFNILMPVGLLKELVSKDWDMFRNELLEIDCKGILMQVVNDLYGLQPDVFFRTKHPIIAETLIQRIIPNKDDQFQEYEKIISKISLGEINSRTVNDLLRYFKVNETFNIERIDRLYDLAFQQLDEDPYFLLIYSINLQQRKELKFLEKALRLINYAESLIEYRNHRFIHRKAVILFEIAKLYYVKESTQLIMTNKYLSDAKDFFEIKIILDPCSSYSYVNYLEMILWIIDKIKLEENDFLRHKILIEEMFDLAERTVFENFDKILELKKKYTNDHLFGGSEEKYLELLDKYYINEKTQPLALILKFNFLCNVGKEDVALPLLSEMEYLSSINEISKFLFKYYGRNLHRQEYRLKLFELVRKRPDLEDKDSLRFNYFMYVANDYNQLFIEAKSYIDSINQRYETLHPDFSMIWKNEDASKRIFEGSIILTRWKSKRAYFSEIQQNFRIMRKSSDNYVEGTKVKCILHFFLNGICAEIIKE